MSKRSKTIKKFFRKVFKYAAKVFAVLAVIFVLGYLINNVIYGKLVWENALKFQNKGDCYSSIELYNYAVSYFSKTDFIKANREKYIAVQYKKAICYLMLRKIEEADAAIKNGMYLMTNSYGVKSTEYAKYVRQYVVDYYIQKRDFNSAKDYLRLSEYFYKMLKTDRADMAEINRLYGDMCLAMGKIDLANRYYMNAYRLASSGVKLDNDSLILIFRRVGDMYHRNHEVKKAVLVYSKLLDLLEKQNCKDKDKYAYVKWLLGNAYAKEGKHETAIAYYDDAYEIIKKLPNTPNNFLLKQNINQLRFDMIKSYTAVGRIGTAARLQKEIKNNSSI